MLDVISAEQHSVFILADRRHASHFKVGLGAAPGTAAREEARRRHGAGRASARTVQVHITWRFQSYHAAFHVEQAVLEMLRRFEYPEIDEGHWFEIDRDSLAFVVAAIEPLVDAIHEAESQLKLASAALNPDKPYGRYRLRQTLTQFSARIRATRSAICVIFGVLAFTETWG